MLAAGKRNPFIEGLTNPFGINGGNMKKLIFAGIVILFVSIIAVPWFVCNVYYPTGELSSLADEQTIGIVETPEVEPTLNLSTENKAIDCENAKTYYEDGEYELANNAFGAILATERLSKCALEGMTYMTALVQPEPTITPTPTQTPTPTPNAATSVPVLMAIGDFDGAWTEAKAGVKSDPMMAQHIPICLRLWKSLTNYFTLYVIPVIGFALLLWVLIVFLFRVIKGRTTYQLDLNDFDFGSFDKKEGIAGSLGKSLTARIELTLKRKFDQLENNQKGLVNSPINPPDLPSIAPASISTLWSFFSKLFPTKVIEVNGLMETNSVKGKGFSLKLIRKDTQQIIGSTIIWEKEKNMPPLSASTEESTETFFTLADLAAAWIFWIYCRLKSKDLRNVFGTSSCESYQWWSLSTNPDLDKNTEEKYLQQALDSDNRNSFALLNLGRMDSQKFEKIQLIKPRDRKTNPRVFLEAASQKLSRVIKLCDPESLPAIQAQYNLGCLIMDLEEFNKDALVNKKIDMIDIDLVEKEKITSQICFAHAYEGINQTKANISQNLKYAIQMPHIEKQLRNDNVDFVKILKRVEAVKEKECDLSFNLACLYSELSEVIQTIPNVLQALLEITNQEVQQDKQKVITAFQTKISFYLEEALISNPKLGKELSEFPVDPCFKNQNEELYWTLVNKYK